VIVEWNEIFVVKKQAASVPAAQGRAIMLRDQLLAASKVPECMPGLPPCF
jgi:hypothetical protein